MYEPSDAMVATFKGYTDGTSVESGPGKLIIAGEADRGLLVKRIVVSVIIAIITFFIMRISALLFIVGIVGYFIFACMYLGDLHDSWSSKTYIAVYENGYSLNRNNSSNNLNNYNAIVNVEMIGRCIRIYKYNPAFDVHLYYLTNQEQIYYAILEQIRVKTGRVKEQRNFIYKNEDL